MITSAQAKRLLEVNVVNLAKRVADGHVLSPREAAMIGAIVAPADPAPVFAPSQSALGELLGVTRQLIPYHCKRPASPGRTRDGRYHVASWRTYLRAFGRVPVSGPSGEATTGPRLDFRDGVWAAIENLESEVPLALAEVGIDAPPDAVRQVWQRIARAFDRCAAKWGYESYFQAGTDAAEHS